MGRRAAGTGTGGGLPPVGEGRTLAWEMWGRCAVGAPAPPTAPTQSIDARDLAGWTVRMVERGAGGVFNAVGPPGGVTLAELVETSRRAAGTDATVTWVPEDFLAAQGVEPWSDLPAWLPSENAGFLSFDAGKAVAEGLAHRPLEQTIRETLAWRLELPDEPMAAGISPERERAVLAAWHAAKE